MPMMFVNAGLDLQTYSDCKGQKRCRMISHSLTFTIAWGECDPFGLVYYPTMFTWFNEVEHDLLRRIGFGTRTLIQTHKAAFVMGEVQMRFTGASSYGDEIVAELKLEKLGGASLTWAASAQHVDGRPVCEGRLVRIHAQTEDDGSLVAARVPNPIREALEKEAP